MAKHHLLMGAGALAVLAAAAGLVAGGGEDSATGAATTATGTTRIERKDLVETEEVDGKLGYSDARSVATRFKGTVTWLPRSGATVRPGRKLLEVDGRAVYLLDGGFPAYRALTAGLHGDDVRQLERNLRDLGKDPDGDMEVDGDWDYGTTEAVKRWQRDRGLDDTGTIELGRVVFAPGTRRVGDLRVKVGDSAGAGPVMTTTSTKRIVTIDLITTKQSLAKRGARVTVQMPDGDEVAGTIVRVGRVAQAQTSADGEELDPTIKLIVKLRGSRGGGLDQAPVDVALEQQRARDVLTVPVSALLAQSGGRFAVEVREGARRRLVPVETGLHTDGDVEISGPGLRPGMLVTNAEV